MGRRRRKLPVEPVRAVIESLSHEGRGITHIHDKTIFVDGALPDEEVLFQYKHRRSRFDEGKLVEVIKSANRRIDAKCSYFGLCGGCSLQHMPPEYQLQHKQQVLMENFKHMGHVKCETILAPVTGPVWGYRRKARLAVKYVDRKGKVLVGFREKYSPYVAEIASCEILHPVISKILVPLQNLVRALTIYRQLPQIEVAVAENLVALVFRHLAPLEDNDREKLQAFSTEYNLSIFLQPGGLDSVIPLLANQNEYLEYRLDKFDLIFQFLPNDFTQVNFDINRQMVNLALDLLAPDENENILDLFCGLGNFSLPLARHAARVTGLEDDKDLIDRAKHNAFINRIHNADFLNVNLMTDNLDTNILQQSFDKVLIDPPRSGAREVINQLNYDRVNKIVYVSCNPATLARDAGILVNEKDFKLSKAGVLDMFPHTSHVESIALFEKKA